jgi:hypothetical protein
LYGTVSSHPSVHCNKKHSSHHYGNVHNPFEFGRKREASIW